MAAGPLPLQLLLFSICTLFVQLSLPTTVYVDPSAPSGGDGRSWLSAFNTLDRALDRDGNHGNDEHDEIWLMGGHTYTPSHSEDRTDCFMANHNVSIYGGFDGSESNINDRGTNTNTAISIISGDIGVSLDHSDDCYHVMQHTRSLSLDHVVIQHGNANHELHGFGGRIVCSDPEHQCSLSLIKVIVRNNSALNGGGLFVNDSSVSIKDSLFEYNRAIEGIFCVFTVGVCVYLCFCIPPRKRRGYTPQSSL